MNIFKEMIRVWKGKTFMDSIMSDFKRMMKEIYTMFDNVTSLLFQHKRIPGINKRIYDEDHFVNKSERKIRKRIIEHLAVQPGVDIGPSLIMMSIVKDAERIGDYCKNLLEVYHMFKVFNKKHKYYSTFKQMRDKIVNLIFTTDQSFRKSWDDKARQVMEDAFKIEKDCDQLLQEFSNSKMTANEAVNLTLMSRHFKRIAAHLSNIASAVIYPVHRIDFSLDKAKRKD
ncbi:MAG: phosphate uptake regulator PhoU [Spirochaetes bacterium]|nr:phosphate uptake regulator PhoU [Spirochaetota bacterium]